MRIVSLLSPRRLVRRFCRLLSFLVCFSPFTPFLETYFSRVPDTDDKEDTSMAVNEDTVTPVKAPRTRREKKEEKKKGKDREEEKESSKEKETVDDGSTDKALRQRVKVRSLLGFLLSFSHFLVSRPLILPTSIFLIPRLVITTLASIAVRLCLGLLSILSVLAKVPSLLLVFSRTRPCWISVRPSSSSFSTAISSSHF